MKTPSSAAAAARQAILAVVAAIPPGVVSTYGIVAARAGLPRRARLVGQVLASLPPGSGLPWHRVLAAGGRIALPAGSASWREQLVRLAAEGVITGRGRVDLDRYGWAGPAADLDRWLWTPRDEK